MGRDSIIDPGEDPSGPRDLGDFRSDALSRVAITPGAAEVFDSKIEIAILLRIYTAGDWGEIDDHDKNVNEQALLNRGRIMGAYDIGPDNTRVWIITDPDWHTTTLLLPSEY
jgi:hypothetical protein